jgi:hypothetical protein
MAGAPDHELRGRTFEVLLRQLAELERPSASAGERIAAARIAAGLRDLGCRVEIEAEPAHGGYWWPLGLLNGVGFLAGLGLACAAGSARPHRRYRRLAAMLLAGTAAAGIWDDVGGGRMWFRRLLPRRPTYNVVAETGDREAADTVVLIAHHDAAHSGLVFHPRLPRFFAKLFPRLHERSRHSFPIMYLVWLGPVLVCAAGLLDSLPHRSTRRSESAVLLAAGLALSGGSVAAMADIGARRVVPGANDNLSSVAVLFDLAAALRERPLCSLRVLLLSTGSEESFMEGMRGFGERHFPRLPRSSTQFICLECVGGPRLLLLEGEGMLRMRDYTERTGAALLRAARNAGVELGRGLWTVAATDALIALRAGYEVAQLASIDEATKFPANYHWPSDTPENLTWETIGHAASICEAFLRERAAAVGRPAEPQPAVARDG